MDLIKIEIVFPSSNKISIIQPKINCNLRLSWGNSIIWILL